MSHSSKLYRKFQLHERTHLTASWIYNNFAFPHIPLSVWWYLSSSDAYIPAILMFDLAISKTASPTS